MKNDKRQSNPMKPDSGRDAAGSGTPQTERAGTAENPVLSIYLPGLKIPSLNALLNMHWTMRSRLHKLYSRRLRNCESQLREAIAEHRSTVIISWEEQSSSATKSRVSSGGMTRSTSESNGSTGRKKARFPKWRSRKSRRNNR